MGGAEAGSPTPEVQGGTMSTTKKNTIDLPVETVDNLRKQIEYLNTTMEFWKLHEKWPGNLINDVLKELNNELIDIIDFNS